MVPEGKRFVVFVRSDTVVRIPQAVSDARTSAP